MLQRLPVILLLCLFQNTQGQTPETLLEKISLSYTPEKIYVHYDKASYIAGETIWFKAYLNEGFLPAAKSTVLNIELLNDSGRIIDRKFIPIFQSAAVGNFDIDKNLPQGIYTVRAYTRRLMNFGTDHFYFHPLNIYNPQTVSSPTNEIKKFSIYFLPEGGNITGNVNNVIAFKCTDSRGYPANAEGTVKDASGKVQVTFKTKYNGMGAFEFVPKAGETYSAECVLGENEKRSVALPSVLSEGATLNLKMTDKKTSFEVNRSTVVSQNLQPEYLLGVVENTVVFKVPLTGSGKIITGLLPVQDLPSGILQITLFNKNNQPLAERLMFVNSGDFMAKANLVSHGKGLSPRQKNSYSLDLADTLHGTFSLSVTDVDTEIEDTITSENILTRLMLTADLKGFVYNPDYYLESNDDIHAANLDLVMLTHGWRRYTWNEIFADRFPKMSFKDMNYISQRGIAYDLNMNTPLKNTELTVFVKTRDGLPDIMGIVTDTTGAFDMPGLIFEDTAKFSFQKNTGKNKKINLAFTSPTLSSMFYTPGGYRPGITFNMPTVAQMSQIGQSLNFASSGYNRGVLLDEVKINVKGKSKTQQYEKKYVTGTLGGNAKETLDFLEEPTNYGGNILDYLKARVNGVNITGGPGSYSINYRNTRSLIGGPIEMNIFLNETQVDPNMVSTLLVSQVAMVKIYSTGVLAGTGGAIAIYTKKGSDYVVPGYTELLTAEIVGFSPVKEFFSPDYSSAKDKDILRDERITLYWNPYLVKDAEHKKIDFSFFNSDKAKRLKVILEGILEDGKLVHVEKIME